MSPSVESPNYQGPAQGPPPQGGQPRVSPVPARDRGEGLRNASGTAEMPAPTVAPVSNDPQRGGYTHAPGLSLPGGGEKLRGWLRRSWIIVLTSLAGTLVGLYVYGSSPPVFESRATIEIMRFKQDAAELSEDEKIRLTGMGEIASIVEKLRMLHLYQAAAESHLFHNRVNLVPRSREFRLPWNTGATDADEPSATISPTALAGRMRGWVTVSWRENTTLIDLKARHSDPEIAKDTLQAVVEEYERLTDQSVEGSSENTLEYIMASADEVKQALLKTEMDLQRYASCIELSAEIEAAQRSIIELEKRYLERWPALVEAKKLDGILSGVFSRELDQVLKRSPEENEFWKGGEDNLAGLSVDDLSAVRLRFVKTRASVLQKDQESNRLLYDNLMTKLKEGQINKGYVAKHFELVEPPRTPGGPVSPVKALLVRNGLTGGAAVGCAIVFGLGFLDRRVQSVAQLESRFPVPVIGAFSVLPKAANTDSRPLVMVDENADESDREPFRALRASISLINPDVSQRSLLITSSLPSEGKSWIAANLAIAFARQGERTVLIDADLRKPRQAEIFGIDKDGPGLTDLISGTADQSTAFYAPVEGLDSLLVLPAGSKCSSPSEFLASQKVKNLLEALPADRIIIDTAPLLPVADTLPLTAASDAVFLVCHVGETPMGAVEKAWQLLENSGNNTPQGLIANRLTRRSRKGGNYSYQGGYSYGYGYGD